MRRLVSCGFAALAFSVAVFLFATGIAAAKPCPPGFPVEGKINAAWAAQGANTGSLGCPVSAERDTPDGGGRYNDFENGQIVLSRDQEMIVTAYTTSDAVVVVWKVLRRYNYDFFVVRWDVDAQEHKSALGCDVLGIKFTKDPTSCWQQDVKGSSRTEGQYSIPRTGNPAGRYSVFVEGCDKAGIIQSTSACNQGFSGPVFVDVGYIDVAHKVDGSPLPSATSIAEAQATLADRARIGFQRGCAGSFGGELDSEFAFKALSKLYMATHPGASDCGGNPISDVKTALTNAKANGNVGTNGICRTGDYDMALRFLIPLMYEYSTQLGRDAYRHVLHDLLTENGGSDQIVDDVNDCGVSAFETENHVLMIESSRYLTNQLLLSEAEGLHLGDPQSPELANARRLYDNQHNGMEDWMLTHLQGFLKTDFHEYNARPYASFVSDALRNLANYADDGKSDGRVRTAAQMVLDYLAAKFAVSSMTLRRAAPFRRHYDHRAYGPLFGNWSDEGTWQAATWSGDTSLLFALRYGRADWGAKQDLAFPAIGSYQVPDMILDLAMNKTSNHYFQAFHHEGVETYAAQTDFLISAGGRWESNRRRDQVNTFLFGRVGKRDTNGAGLPITLMPRDQGADLAELVQIDGYPDEGRANTCVAPGFACGLNPVVPDRLLSAHVVHTEPCNLPVSGFIQAEWEKLGGAGGPLGCPRSAETAATEGTGRVQDFSGGQIVWSQTQNMVVAAYQQPQQIYFVLDWQITATFSYDFFNVRWDKDGTNIGQHSVKSSDANGSPTRGSWALPRGALGHYRIIVEGCDSRFLRSSVCRQGWSSPINLDLPSANSCARASGPWIFLSFVGAGCYSPNSRGFFVAIYVDACPADTCNTSFGFFEAVEALESGVHFGSDVLAEFQQLTLQRNGSRQYSPNGANTYLTADGDTISFTPNHDRDHWGILALSKFPALPSEIGLWDLAKGDVINADGKGCVIITNLAMGQALVLDMVNAAQPKRTPHALVPGLSCAMFR